MHFLNHKIPPPLLLILCIGLSRLSRQWVAPVKFMYQDFLGLVFFIIALISIFGMIEFWRHKTTVNPIKLHESTSLVTSGVYGYTRNPMYLGLTCLLISVNLFWGTLTGLLLVPCFILFLTYFQIIPEEKAMKELFKDDFERYCQRVRRWI